MKGSCFCLAYRKARSAWNRAALTLALAFLQGLFPGAHSAAQTVQLHIAAAADLEPVLPVLQRQYEQATGVKIIASYGSSAALTEQILNGDPQDVFLSADEAHPQRLISVGLADESHPLAYARGVLVLWARHDSPAQPLSLNVLTSTRVKKIAVANALHAPYGVAARQALENLHLYSQLAPKLAIAENIGQTAEFAESGNAQAAFISLTIASSAHDRSLGSFIRLPAGSYQEIRQCAILLRSSRNQKQAQQFLQWLTSKQVQQSLPRFGLDPAN